jgi:hypothetical protein
MRSVSITPELATLLGRLRAHRGLGSERVRLRLQDLESVEKELRLVLPDPILAYLAAGVSAWGDDPPRLGAVLERTLEVRERIDESGETDEGATRSRFAIVDDDASGNYLGVLAGAARESDVVTFFDHEEGYVPGTRLRLRDVLRDLLEDEGVGDGPPLEVELYDEPVREPTPVWAVHAKFGRGRVLAEVDGTVTVVFEEMGEKRLKRSFLIFE